jgi:hypothetical protein
MKPRDRVAMALDHQEPDRCPMQASFTPEFAMRLRQEMALRGRRFHNPHGGGNTYELERALGEDMLLTSVGWANSYYMADEVLEFPYQYHLAAAIVAIGLIGFWTQFIYGLIIIVSVSMHAILRRRMG